MKREFGKKLIEEFFPRVDLTHVIDTTGAYIPGHGTPTVILFGRNRKPVVKHDPHGDGYPRRAGNTGRSGPGARVVGDRAPDRSAGLAERIRKRR